MRAAHARDDALREMLLAPLGGSARGGSDHPDPELVALHAAGELGAEDALAITRHLVVCDDGRCAGVLHDVVAGAAVARAALYGPSEEASDAAIAVSRSEHRFACPDALWAAFETMAREEGTSVEGLLGEAMRSFVQQRAGLVAPVAPSRVRVKDAALEPPRERNTPTLQRSYLPRAPSSSRRSSPDPAPPAARLSLVLEGHHYEVDKDRYVVGRGGPASDLAIDDPGVSRQHAVIEHAGGAYYLVDMGSTNGIEYEGERIARKAIAHGDRFRIGDHEIEFLFG